MLQLIAMYADSMACTTQQYVKKYGIRSLLFSSALTSFCSCHGSHVVRSGLCAVYLMEELLIAMLISNRWKFGLDFDFGMPWACKSAVIHENPSCKNVYYNRSPNKCPIKT